MVFLCCHPLISPEGRVALSLKAACGFNVREISRAFLCSEPTIAQRLVRAKRTIREQAIQLTDPEPGELRERLDSVLEVLYFLFNEGYAAHEGENLLRKELCTEALRLARLVAASPLSEPRVHALTALMALQAARLPARVDDGGDLVQLHCQDQAAWDQGLLSLGFWHFEQSLKGDEVTEYHVQAAIAATHARAAGDSTTDWPLILELYDQLAALNPSPVVMLNRAVALAKVKGAAAGLQALEALEHEKLANYHLLLSVRGHLHRDLGENPAAAECFRAALELPCSAPERRFLARMLASCAEPAGGAVTS